MFSSIVRRVNSRGRAKLLAACCAVAMPALATPTVQTLSDSHGSYYLVNNGALSFQLYTSGALIGKVTSIVYNGQQMVGSKDLYDDLQGTGNIAFYSTTNKSLFSVRTGSNFADISLEQPASATQPLDATLHYILQDGVSGFNTYLTYHHTSAMADYTSTENRFAEFFNDSLFHYSSIDDNYWGYQAAGDADRQQGRFVTAETSDMRGVPSEYIKAYETKYDWHDTHANEGGVTGLVTAANTSTSTKPISGTDYGVWNINNYRSAEAWSGGPTQPQSVWADGASFIVSPAGSHQGGPQSVYSGNIDEAFGPYFTYFNTGANINSMRADAEAQQASPALNSFYDSLNLPYYATTTQRGTVNGQIRITDGSNMNGATVVLSTFDPTAYSTSPISQEYQRRANGYSYWVTPNKDGTFSLPDVRPGTYRVTVIKPGNYREGTFDNITVSANTTTNVGNLAWTPDVNGKGIWQIGTFDRSSGEFKAGESYNNWIDTNQVNKEFPSGVNYTVNPANPFNDTQNWKNNWPLVQQNGTSDFYTVNFNLATAPSASATFTLTVSLAGQEFINDLAALINGTSHRVDASFNHTSDNASITNRSDDTSGRVMYRKLSFPGSYLHSGNNTIQFHIVGGDMEWDAVRLDEQDGTSATSDSQWDGGTGNWSDASHWGTQQYGYTSINKGAATINGAANPSYPNDTSTTFADGAVHTAPTNGTYDAFINGGVVTLDTSPSIQKLSLLSGTMQVVSGTPTITANDVFALAGEILTGTGSINALSTTTINFDNTINAGFKVIGGGAVSWTDGSTVTITGAGSQWTTLGMGLGSGTLLLGSGAGFSASSGLLNIGSLGNVFSTSSTITAAGIINAGSFSSTGTVSLTGVFTNSGSASIGGAFTNAGVSNTAGLLVISGTNTSTGSTNITGGAVQFASASGIGGSGRNVNVGAGGAVSFVPGITDSTFLSRISTTSTGAFALTSADAATALDFTSGSLSSFGSMGIGAVGNVTYSGSYTPANSTYRLGGGGGTLNYSPVIAGNNNLIVGNTGSSGTVTLNTANTYTGLTTLRGGILSVASLGNGSAASPIGMSSNAPESLVFDGGTLQITGTSTSDRGFTLFNTGGTIEAAGTATFTNPGIMGFTGNGNLNLIGAGAGTLTAVLNGGGSLIKDGSGSWTVLGQHGYSGDTVVNRGTLILGTGAALPSGSGKGNLNLAGSNGALEINGNNLTINGLSGFGTLDNAVAGNKNVTLGTVNASGSFDGIISGNINLIKVGSGSQVLANDNTYLGTTTISVGTLQVGIGGTPVSYGPGDGNLKGKLGAGNIINNATLVFNRGYLTTCTNVISGTGTLKQIANAQLALGGSNTYTGPTVIGSGTPNIGLGGTLDTGLAFTGDCSLNATVLANGSVTSSIGASSNAASNLILDGGTLFYSPTTAASTDRLFTVTQNGGGIYASGALTFTNTGAIVMSGTGDRTLSLEGDSTSACTFDSDIGDPASGKTSLTKDRSVTWVINSSAALTYSGDTTMLMGTLKLGTGAALPFGTGKGNLVFGTSTDFSSAFNPTLEMNGNDVSINALIGGLANSTYSRVDNNVGVHTLSVGNANATGEYDGLVTGSINFTKTGSGTETLTGSSTYLGKTTISNGTLVASIANGSIASGIGQSSNIAANLVLDGGTFRGIGSTDRLFTMTANGGTLDNSSTVSFTNATGAIALPAGVNVTLNLTGTGTASNALNPLIGDAGGGFVTSVTKTGTGIWAFGAANAKTYSGDTHVMQGTLQTLAANALSAKSNMVIDSAATLDINATNQSINALSGIGAVIDTAGTGQTFTIGANNGNGSFGGSISGAMGLTKTGSGSQTLAGADSFTGGVAINNGTLVFARSHTLASLTVGPGKGQLAAGGTNLLTITGSLTINSGGALDMNDNDAILKSATLGNVQTMIGNGFAGGAWTGASASITSSIAQSIAANSGNIHKTEIGYATAGSLGVGSFDGASVGSTDVVLRYTMAGDANLDGIVNIQDFNAVAGGFGSSGVFWHDGDFNYDGVVNALDLNAIATNFGSTQAAPLPDLPALGALVPEPATLGSLMLGMAIMGGRRRNRMGKVICRTGEKRLA